MQDYYQVLGVSEQSTLAVIRIAFEGKVKALRASSLGEAERNAEDRLLRLAFVTLTDPIRKAWYDRKLEKQRAALTAEFPKWAAVAAVALVTAGFTALGFQTAERSRERDLAYYEGLRIDAERAKARAAAAVQLAELAEARAAREANDALRRDREVRHWMERDRNYSNAQARYNDAYTRSEWDRQRYYVLTEARTTQYVEDRRQRNEVVNRYVARAELDRQVQWMENREAEEDRIRSEKHYRAQQEAASIKAREAMELRRTNGLR